MIESRHPKSPMTSLPAIVDSGWRRSSPQKRHRFAATCFVALALSLVQGCQANVSADRRPAVASADDHVRSIRELRRDGVVMQAWDLSCGAAALATLLNFQHGDPVTEHEITRVLIDRDIYLEQPELVKIRQGFSLADLKRFTDARGYGGQGFGKLEFADLDAMAPLILPIFENGYSHFVVYRGRYRDRVLVSDPAFGVRTLRVSTFKRLWRPINNAHGRVGFIVRRLDGQEPPNRLTAEPTDFITIG